ncbi:MAG: ribose transport system permease protein [Verrucomicrobiales bacterium]|jgi:ribose transport system permease protein
MNKRSQLSLQILNAAPLLLCFLVLAVFALQSPRFLELSNLTNILVQSSGTAVAAIGMTIVLITAGVDLSVGSVMFVAVAVAGKFIFNDQPVLLGFCAAVGVGIIAGLLNALFVTRFRVAPFVVTLAMLFVARDFGSLKHEP